MNPHAIISYDDTPDDQDALTLGRLFGEAGARLTLAYVRHCAQTREDREALAEFDAATRVECGARRLDDPYVERRVVMSPSTAGGLSWLAERDQADLIVFGSEYRTPAGRVAVSHSAQTLLERGPAALAIAPAGYRSRRELELDTIGVLAGSADEAAIETAFSLAERVGAVVVDRDRAVDLLVVGSRTEVPVGRVAISSRSQNGIEEATCPVLVVARATPLRFETLVTA